MDWMPPRTTSAVLTVIQRLIASTAAGKVGSLIPSAGSPKKMKNIRRRSGTARASSTAQPIAVPTRRQGTKRSTPRTSPSAVPTAITASDSRSEEHTSELQSHHDLVCRLLLEKKNNHTKTTV